MVMHFTAHPNTKNTKITACGIWVKYNEEKAKNWTNNIEAVTCKKCLLIINKAKSHRGAVEKNPSMKERELLKQGLSNISGKDIGVSEHILNNYLNKHIPIPLKIYNLMLDAIKEKQTSNVPWTKYKDLFPTRYHTETFFDGYVAGLLTFPHMNILDLGGGVDGNQILKMYKDFHDIWFLDPYVSKPDWVKTTSLAWKQPIDPEKYFTTYSLMDLKYPSILELGLIVARGCLNYLTDEQLKLIPKLLLDGGKFVANTINTCPKNTYWRRNHHEEYCGRVEAWRFVPPNIIQHALLEPLNEQDVHKDLNLTDDPETTSIKHQFIYRTREEWELFFPNASFIPYGANSLLISYTKRN